MTITVRTYYSTDASAPVLSGQVGALIGVLDACLVNGYGAKTAAGWTKPYSGTNLAAYRMAAGPAGQARGYLRVDDTGTQAGRLVGYCAMTGISAGTDSFPNDLQFAGGLYTVKSTAASSTARPWVVVACERAFYCFIFSADTTYGADPVTTDYAFGFGAFASYKPSDAFNLFLSANATSGTTGSNSGLGKIDVNPSTGTINVLAQNSQGTTWIARAYTQILSAITPLKCTNLPYTGNNNTVGASNSGSIYPDPMTGAMKLSRIVFLEDDGSGHPIERGYMPGFWGPMHALRVPVQYSTVTGAGDLAGRTFLILPIFGGATDGRVAMEIAGGDWGLA